MNKLLTSTALIGLLALGACIPEASASESDEALRARAREHVASVKAGEGGTALFRINDWKKSPLVVEGTGKAAAISAATVAGTIGTTVGVSTIAGVITEAGVMPIITGVGASSGWALTATGNLIYEGVIVASIPAAEAAAVVAEVAAMAPAEQVSVGAVAGTTGKASMTALGFTATALPMFILTNYVGITNMDPAAYTEGDKTAYVFPDGSVTIYDSMGQY